MSSSEMLEKMLRIADVEWWAYLSIEFTEIFSNVGSVTNTQFMIIFYRTPHYKKKKHQKLTQ